MTPIPTNVSGSPVRILLFATTHWMSTARLAAALADFGCRVDLIAPAGHPALLTEAIAKHYKYWPFWPLGGLRRAIRVSQPDLLLLADELSGLLVEELAAAMQSRGDEEARGVLDLIRRSFGRGNALPLTRSRITLLTAAAMAGVPVPPTLGLQQEADLRRLPEEVRGPWMLKADATWGGFGVRRVDESMELGGTWRSLRRPLDLPRSLKRGWKEKEWGHLYCWLKGGGRDVIAQGFVSGRERTGMAVCKEGQVCAAVCFDVEQVRCANGPASIVQAVQDPRLLDSMQRTAAALGISGFCGFDFMLEEKTGTPLLLEMNMRPTQLAHLSLGAGQDLCAALLRELVGRKAVQDRPTVAEQGRIALFPQEILRDPSGDCLHDSFHDVPWGLPRLMDFALRTTEVPALLAEDPLWADRLPRLIR